VPLFQSRIGGTADVRIPCELVQLFCSDEHLTVWVASVPVWMTRELSG